MQETLHSLNMGKLTVFSLVIDGIQTHMHSKLSPAALWAIFMANNKTKHNHSPWNSIYFSGFMNVISYNLPEDKHSNKASPGHQKLQLLGCKTILYCHFSTDHNTKVNYVRNLDLDQKPVLVISLHPLDSQRYMARLMLCVQKTPGLIPKTSRWKAAKEHWCQPE